MRIRKSQQFVLEDEDFARFETAVQNALTTAIVRVLPTVIEAVTQALRSAAPTITQEPAPIQIPIPTAPEPVPAPVPIPPATEPVPEPEPIPTAPVVKPRHEEIKEHKQRRQPRSLLKHLQKSDKRPEGFVTREEACKSVELQDASDVINKWVWDREVEGIIVYGTGLTPTKGLDGGRLFVKKSDVIAREELRVAQSDPAVRLRIARAARERKAAA